MKNMSIVVGDKCNTVIVTSGKDIFVSAIYTWSMVVCMINIINPDKVRVTYYEA